MKLISIYTHNLLWWPKRITMSVPISTEDKFTSNWFVVHQNAVERRGMSCMLKWRNNTNVGATKFAYRFIVLNTAPPSHAFPMHNDQIERSIIRINMQQSKFECFWKQQMSISIQCITYDTAHVPEVDLKVVNLKSKSNFLKSTFQFENSLATAQARKWFLTVDQ